METRKLKEQLRIFETCHQNRTRLQDKMSPGVYNDIFYDMLRRFDQRELQAAKVIGKLCNSKKDPLSTLIAVKATLLIKAIEDQEKDFRVDSPEHVKQLTSSWFKDKNIPHIVVTAPIFLDGPDLWELEKKYQTEFPLKLKGDSLGFDLPPGERLGDTCQVKIHTFKNEEEAYSFFKNSTNIFVYDKPTRHWEEVPEAAVYARCKVIVAALSK